jgi:hypothetical protein
VKMTHFLHYTLYFVIYLHWHLTFTLIFFRIALYLRSNFLCPHDLMKYPDFVAIKLVSTLFHLLSSFLR